MNRVSLLVLSLAVLALLLSACGPRISDDAQPIKFETIYSGGLAGRQFPLHGYDPSPGSSSLWLAPRARAA